MDLIGSSRLIIEDLIREELLESRCPEIVGRDLAKLIEETRRPPFGHELEDWLDQHRLVQELYAGGKVLDKSGTNQDFLSIRATLLK